MMKYRRLVRDKIMIREKPLSYIVHLLRWIVVCVPAKPGGSLTLYQTLLSQRVGFSLSLA